MGWFRKAKPERRFWCPKCEKILTKADGVTDWGGSSAFSHRLWMANVIEGVDFGTWEWHTKLLAESEDSPHATPTADGRLSVVDSGTLSLVEGE